MSADPRTDGIDIDFLRLEFCLDPVSYTHLFFESQIHGFLPLALVGFLAQAASVLLLFLFSVSRTFTTKLIQFFFWLLSKLRLVKRPEEKSKRVHAQLESYLNNNKSMNHNWKLSLQLYGLTF